jgi:hypothetical protein
MKIAAIVCLLITAFLNIRKLAEISNVENPPSGYFLVMLVASIITLSLIGIPLAYILLL